MEFLKNKYCELNDNEILLLCSYFPELKQKNENIKNRYNKISLNDNAITIDNITFN